ncbi:putative alcohol dehydrogenase [Talaromyces proteolyticus]|uniref:Alcohol dehydrogenase n=1 Tax=Talaromyces proteolyticus TaxID=1131652 RepID=A0AAD4Q4U8_9EURO|nr:putative alcohol dehydrogenase [Talaromyces proteolyticus]KAH8703641.1 putative alcohol dehydrogenase [Talaromyces proteolyticus]
MTGSTFTVFRDTESTAIKADQTTLFLDAHDVLVKITHAGLCGTDQHFRHKGIALGHEGAGVVEEIGQEVTIVEIGDRVGHDNYCDNQTCYGFGDTDVGTFANKLPNQLEPEFAAPLMCGGATVWSTLTTYPLKAGDRVGVLGIGGLGHMAIEFASKLGCNVVVLSHSESKKEEALKFGAKEFHVTDDNDVLKTSIKNPIPLAAATGSIYPLSVSFQPSSVPIQQLINNGIRIQGSAVGSRPSIQRMLDFVVLHIYAPLAFEVLSNGKMRYRGVLLAKDS